MKTGGCFRVYGQVCGAQSKHGLPGLIVQALDKDLFIDDRLGTATTDEEGRFDIRYEASDFTDFFERRPDLYVRVRAPDGALLLTTEEKVRYEASETEAFHIEVSEINERIADSEALQRRIVEDPVLQRELADAMAGLLEGKKLLDATLDCTFVPVVAERVKTAADLFVAGLGPQPEPPDHPVMASGSQINPQPEPPFFKPQPDPWIVRWWWAGVPMPELLHRLDQYRAMSLVPDADLPPVRSAAELAYRIMADQPLVKALSLRIDQVLTRNGVVLAPEVDYSFVPRVYARPRFVGEALTARAEGPMVFDWSGQADALAWIRPLEGIPPAELLRELVAHQHHSGHL